MKSEGHGQTELSRRIDQRIAMFLACTFIPPRKLTFDREESADGVVYTLYFNGKRKVGQIVLKSNLTDDKDGLIQTIQGESQRVEFQQFGIALKRDLQFFYQAFWVRGKKNEE